MKKLICAKDLEKIVVDGVKEIEIDKDTILTPSAKDIIKNNEIKILIKEKKSQDNLFENMDMEKLMEFFKVVSKDQGLQKAIMKILLNEKKFEKETDLTGFTLIKGDTIKYDKIFKNLNIFSQDLVKTKDEIIGFLKIDGDSFIKKTKSKGNLYVVDGEIDVILNGKRYFGKKGDLINIPEKIELKIGSKNIATLLYFSKDLTWSESLL
ncbi:hypothetical protein NON08_09175 [Cetobacterium somerae]|uniref:hypothetical protein n=1 Tax=Cetobacterium sp. NK01 TaxID=2993530 RepID=UPI002116BD39|nr:hypothetical protein [Cetobacterium sp. NK01]MCQ8212689.1 hypothetical protein [Cetobacterium sp. NK01]